MKIQLTLVSVVSMLLFACSHADSAKIKISTVNIGQQTWMDSDLSVRAYNNGDSILEARTEQQWNDACTRKTGCFRVLQNGATIYNGYAVSDPRGICPEGFKIPSMEDFNALKSNFPFDAATENLATYSYYVEEWIGGDDGGLESIEIVCNGKSGFNAKPGGFIDAGISNEGPCNFYWTSTNDANGVIVDGLGYCSNYMAPGMSYSQEFGFSVRAMSNVFLPLEEKKTDEVKSESSNNSTEKQSAPKAEFKVIQEADLSEMGSTSITECKWGILHFRSTTDFGARGQYLGIRTEITSNGQRAELSEVMSPAKQTEFLTMFTDAAKEFASESKKKDPECYGKVKVHSYKISDITVSFTPKGVQFTTYIGDGIWPCEEVITYDHNMTFDEAAPYFILQ